MTDTELAALLPTPRNTFATPIQTSGYFKGLNEGEMDFIKHGSMFGVENTVSKLGRRWVIWSGLTGHGLFATKREAVAMAGTYRAILMDRWAAARGA